MKIYTKQGDGGETGLFGGGTVSKASARVAAYGELDELNSVLGLCRTAPLPAADGTPDAAVDARLREIQSRLFDVGAELATSPEYDRDLGIPLVAEADVDGIERAIDAAETELEPLRAFVLPGGTQPAAYLHLARTACRRAERAIVALDAHERVRPVLLQYVNRLSDFFFVLARLANRRAGIPDVPWVGRGKNG
jgi:cob(I)alamin adenosyltransferase